jgi:superfamily II helicase
MSIAMFYKREIDIEDARAINPAAFKDPYHFNTTVKRLEELSYVRRSGDKFQITQYGAQMLSAYEVWKKQNLPER